MAERCLIVDDDRHLGDWLREALDRRGFDVEVCTSAAEALEAVHRAPFRAIVADVQLQDMNGIELCGRLAADHPEVPVLIVTAFGSLDTAIDAIRAGAQDFLTKPVEIEELALRLGRAIEHRFLRQEVLRLRRCVAGAEGLEDLLGSSAAMRALRDLVGRVAAADATVLLTGESGTGKELVARALHRGSARRDEPFVALNCAALPDTLVESELFGHVRGAFTDARTGREGLVQRAGRGVLFLDEIGDLPLALQPKLLRALQERSVRPVGSEAEVPFEARVVAATNHDLEQAVAEGRFRADLFYRLDVLRIDLPPLRERGSDVLELADQFVRRHAAPTAKRVSGLSRAAAARLLGYAWPGNVRELENCIERAVVLTSREWIDLEDLPERIARGAPPPALATDAPVELVPLATVERRHVARVLDAVGGNKTRAARVLGLDRKTLYRKLGDVDRNG